MSPGPCVVIPHHARRDLLARALEAVQAWPVVVVHDPPLGAPVLELAGVEVLRAPSPVGFAGACNLGLDRAQARGFDAALVLNDDAVPEPGCVDALAAALAPGVGAVGALILTAAGEVESAGIAVSEWGRIRAIRRAPDGPTAVAAVSGACMLVRPDVRFDTAYRHGFEDVALCRDLRRGGLEVRVVPSARCVHAGGASLDRRTPTAQRHAVSGHLRLVGGGWRSPVVVGLAVAQVVREGGPWARLGGIAQGVIDHLGRS